MAASFDPELASEWGTAMGEEFWSKGTNIQEGPGVNIARIENNGRTFEYISGEDPVLGAALVQPVRRCWAWSQCHKASAVSSHNPPSSSPQPLVILRVLTSTAHPLA